MEFRTDDVGLARRISMNKYRANKHGCATDGTLTVESWRALVSQSGACCAVCGRKPDGLVIDHITALRNGGANSITNVQAVCHPCNTKKDKQPIRPIQFSVTADMRAFVEEKGGSQYIIALLRREMTK